MADRSLPLRRLRQILARFGVHEDTSRGKGSHTVFYKEMAGGRFTYPVPGDKQVLVCYVRGCRKKFKLTPDDGISDEESYNA